MDTHMTGKPLQDRYQYITEIGSGGMGTIYQAHDTVLDRDVAVKVLTKRNLGEEGQNKLLREAQAAAKLNHPNIVSIYDAGIEDGIPFIVMEFVQGTSLYHHPPLTIDETINLTRQICSALEHAHNHNIVHRDLKPENVLITDDGTAKLMDFGLARSITSRITSEGTIEGTVFFMAPEQALGQATDHRTDFYSLGVMLYELSTGQLPFTSDDPLQVISQHIYAPVVPPCALNPELPCGLEELILQLLSKRPEDRPTNASEILLALERLDEEDTGAKRMDAYTPIEQIVRGRIVGRDSELREANWLWRKATNSESQVLLISGEPGVGKTRFIQELRTLVEVEGGQVLIGECYAEGSAPCSPIAQILRQIHTDYDWKEFDLPDSYIADWLEIAPDLRHHFPDIPSKPISDPQSEQERMFESMLALCRSIAAQRPILMMMEDAHWADSCTLQFLRHIARRSKSIGLPILIVLTYREIELDETRSLIEMLYDLNRERLATRIKLLRLSKDETQQLLNVMFQEEVSADLLNSIYLETEGNPFYIEEVCKSLIEEGKIYQEGGRWHRRETQELEVPQSVRIAIQSRVSKLSLEAQDTLRFASIFGREFEYEVLKAVSDHDEDTLIDALESAERAQLIVEVEPRTNGRSASSPTFSFAHALIPSTLRESVSGLRRQRLHLRAAIALERIYPDRVDELAPRIGQHFAEAGNGKKAAEYLLKAGDAARRLYAYQEAIDAYEQALIFLREQRDYQHAVRILMQLGLLYHSTFDFDRSRKAYQEGFTLWQRGSEGQPDLASIPAPHPFRQAFGNYKTLDPTLVREEQSATLVDQLFSGLVEMRGALDIVPHVARSWEVLENGKKYIFHLRDDFLWTDGHPVTARDFEYAWKRVLNPKTDSPAASWLYDIRGAKAFHQGEDSNPDAVGVKAVNDQTLMVELDAPTSYFLHLIAFSITYPIPSHIIEKVGENWTDMEHLVTNGPFILDRLETSKKIFLKRNPDYPGQFNGNLLEIELLQSTDWEENVERYERGEIEILGGIPASELERVRQRYANDYITGPFPLTTYLAFNINRPPFDDSRVRRAISHVINRGHLANVILHGSSDPATGGFVPPGVPGHTKDIALPYDPTLGKQLMEEAGFSKGQDLPNIQMYSSDFPFYRTITEAVQAQMKENLGIETEITYFNFPQILDSIAQDEPHIFAMGWGATYPDPDDFLRIASRTLIQPKWNERFDKLVDDARRISDHFKRMKMYEEAEKILTQEAVVLPLLYGRFHLFVKPWVKKFPIQPIRVFSYKDIIIEEHIS
jgi:ABC-type oligopeptide transport system substrate-binding subunit/serine/threonine protein kinase/tetratricopeptide (TPR) repeat protein